MQKPKSFDNVAASLSFTPLELGGHVCVIKNAQETTSKTGKPMLKVALDIADGDPQAGYYLERFKNDDRENKKWPCISYVVTEDKDGNASRGLARFVTSIESSNPGFVFPWDNVELLRDKRVGGVFGQEEYKATDGNIKKATKLMWFCSADKAKDAKVPELKEYKAATTSPSTMGGWASISSSDIPF